MSHRSPTRLGAYSLAVAFLVTAGAALLGTLWNMSETQWGFPLGTKLMLMTAVVMAGLSRLFGRSHPGATILIVGVALPVGAFISLLVSMVKDPTSQNLWPVAVLMLGVVGLAASLAGTLLGSVALRLFRGKAPSREGGA